ncbi:MAG: hypothetical protein K8R58_13870 [Bacteroidales bacterium]|nr:hypothetical protein [Bacteroidales bacterium]
MTEIKSDNIVINESTPVIFSFLGNFNNFEKLMPEQVINWESTDDTCSFTIKGMTSISMRIEDKVEYSKIFIVSYGKVPFTFNLSCFLESCNDKQTKVQLVLNAKLNPMLKMMAFTPLQNLVNILVSKLKEIFN